MSVATCECEMHNCSVLCSQEYHPLECCKNKMHGKFSKFVCLLNLNLQITGEQNSSEQLRSSFSVQLTMFLTNCVRRKDMPLAATILYKQKS